MRSWAAGQELEQGRRCDSREVTKGRQRQQEHPPRSWEWWENEKGKTRAWGHFLSRDSHSDPIPSGSQYPVLGGAVADWEVASSSLLELCRVSSAPWGCKVAPGVVFWFLFPPQEGKQIFTLPCTFPGRVESFACQSHSQAKKTLRDAE